MEIVYNYSPNGRWIVVDIYWDTKRRGIYPPLFTDPEGDSCFSIYQNLIRWIKKCCFNFFFWNFCETTRHFSLRSQNSEYPRIFRVTEANQNMRKLLSTDLVNTGTNSDYLTLIRLFDTSEIFQRPQIAWALWAPAILLVFEKFTHANLFQITLKIMWLPKQTFVFSFLTETTKVSIQTKPLTIFGMSSLHFKDSHLQDYS